MSDCVFCAIASEASPASRFWEDETALGFLDIAPWRPGHALVIPRRHAQRVRELEPGERAHLFEVGSRVADALRASSLPCDDVHFVLNDGDAASQTVPHVHLHVVPRARGDGWRLLGRLLRHPVSLLTDRARRPTLDAQATELRELLERAR